MLKLHVTDCLDLKGWLYISGTLNLCAPHTDAKRYTVPCVSDYDKTLISEELGMRTWITKHGSKLYILSI